MAGTFTLTGVIGAVGNPAQQFVGSFSYSIVRNELPARNDMTCRAVLPLSLPTLVLLAGCALSPTKGKTPAAALTGTYVLSERVISKEAQPEYLVINSDGTFFQFYGSRARRRAFCNTGRWNVSASDPEHIDLVDLMRWEEDTGGTGEIDPDHQITFRAPNRN